MRRGSQALSILVLCGLAAAGDDAAKTKSSHPHFDDRGALVWHTKLADASAAAKKAGKLIFIEYGRAL
jgi:hypothetical protein